MDSLWPNEAGTGAIKTAVCFVVGEQEVNPFRRWARGAPEQPAPEQPAPEQPAPEQPAPEQPAPEQPAPEQPAPGSAAQNSQGPPEAGKRASKLDLAERSYKEVLDATKHQDDKVGRFLTAIAFLTTGAIALITTNPGTAISRDFALPGGSSQPLLAWATGAFLAFTLGSVTLLLLCLSVPVRLPKYSRDPLRGSRLFYSYIAARPAREWSAMWVQDDGAAGRSLQDLEDEITEDYIKESHNLAERTSAKYRHSYEAAWLFVCALLFLGIAIYLRLLTSLHKSGDINLDDELPLFALVTIVSVHAALQVYARAVHDIRSAEKVFDASYAAEFERRLQLAGAKPQSGTELERNRVLYWQRRRTPLSVIAPIGFATAVAGTWRWEGTAPVLAGLSVLIGVWVTFDAWLEDEDPDEVGERIRYNELRAWWFPVVSAVVAAAVAMAAWKAGGAWQLAAIPLPVLVLGIINTSRPARSHAKARKLVRERAVKAAEQAASDRHAHQTPDEDAAGKPTS